MSEPQEYGKQMYDEVFDHADECELTSIVLAVESQRRENDRIEIKPRLKKKKYHGPYCYTRRAQLNGEGITIHYIIYSKSEDVMWKSKRRLDCAHELGHIVLHNKVLRNGEPMPIENEIEADWFALCLLQLHGHVDADGFWPFPKR